MNIYVETNFVLELVFQQEQYQSCQEILALGEAGNVHPQRPRLLLNRTVTVWRSPGWLMLAVREPGQVICSKGQ